MNDKKIELKRYDTFASEAIASGKYISNYELPKYALARPLFIKR